MRDSAFFLLTPEKNKLFFSRAQKSFAFPLKLISMLAPGDAKLINGCSPPRPPCSRSALLLFCRSSPFPCSSPFPLLLLPVSPAMQRQREKQTPPTFDPFVGVPSFLHFPSSPLSPPYFSFSLSHPAKKIPLPYDVGRRQIFPPKRAEELFCLRGFKR